ncbi:MAG: hypothetical protein D3926_22730 [Desulfobacteraceae bacterium]|nr:MAG: hypothetical protein D3926_22730 [Desulfobacteraceae bacterium]
MKPHLMDIRINTKLPKIPPVLPVYLVRAVSLEERQQAIGLFRELLKLDKLVMIDSEDSLYYQGSDGEIQFFRASGSIWADTARADEKYPDECRPWKVMEVKDKNDPENSNLVLVKAEEKRLAKQSEQLFKEAGLLSAEAFFSGVTLDQVAKLDEKGKQTERAVGEANARFLYRLDGIEVDGPGAKTYAFYNPGKNSHQFTGAYHAWRPVKDKRKVKMEKIEEILDQTLMQDPELKMYGTCGSAISIQKVDLCYWALQPDVNQDYIFPTLRVEGNVVYENSSKEPEGFEFSRYYNAVAPQEYARSQIYAHYLVERSV